MMKQDSNPSITTTNPALATVCGHCGVEERSLLHHVRLRGNFRRLCTTCVLRLHPQCFCPGCFGVYHRSPPDDAVVCYKCYSSSHPNCASPPAAGPIPSSRSPAPCSSCLNPNALVLNLNRVENGNLRAIDEPAARLILAAAKISAVSMSKAEVAATTEAERRAKEAAYTKRRAREALDHVVYLMEKEKRNAESNKRLIIANNSVVPMPVPVQVLPPAGVQAAAAADGGIRNGKVDTSSEVLEALNAVELKENGGQIQGFSVESAQGNGVVVMEVEVMNDKDLGVNSVTENGSAKTSQGDKACNGLVPLVGQEQSLEKIGPMEENGVCNPSVEGKH